MTVRPAPPIGPDLGGLAAVTGLATAEKSKATKASRTSGRKRLDDLGTGVLLIRDACVPGPVGGGSTPRTPLDRTQRPWSAHDNVP